ncbi:MAG TPA: hypothetical protein EYP14_09555 [Planctomycetaceae bacterium]|nr:hypothetical protein [Planctomycetaceae bacterium]
MHWLIGHEPVEVFASAAGEARSDVRTEDLTAVFRFADGSTGTVLYTALGSKAFLKERIEVFTDGSTAALDDFRRLTIRGAKRVDCCCRRQDKGHGAELEHFADVILGRTQPQLTATDGIRATICCLAILQSARNGQAVNIDLGLASK